MSEFTSAEHLSAARGWLHTSSPHASVLHGVTSHSSSSTSNKQQQLGEEDAEEEEEEEATKAPLTPKEISQKAKEWAKDNPGESKTIGNAVAIGFLIGIAGAVLLLYSEVRPYPVSSLLSAL